MSAPAPSMSRPMLSLVDNKEFWLHGNKVRVVFRRGRISIGCTDVDVDTARELLRRYDDWANEREYVVQL